MSVSTDGRCSRGLLNFSERICFISRSCITFFGTGTRQFRYVGVESKRVAVQRGRMYAHHNIFGGGSVAFTPMEVAFRVHAARVRLPVAALVRSFAPLFFFPTPGLLMKSVRWVVRRPSATFRSMKRKQYPLILSRLRRL